VRDAVDDGRATAPDREIDARIDGPAPMLGDADQLRQVLGNLRAARSLAIVDAHGGSVEAANAAKGWARFVVRLADRLELVR
jgi:hypothetical protein